MTSGTESLTGLGIRRLDLIAFVILVSLLVPLLLALIEFGVARISSSASLQRIIQAILCGLLAALWVWQQLDSAPGFIKIILPLAIIVVFTFGYVRADFLRNFTGLLAFATPVVIVMFALSYPIKEAILPGETAMAAQSTESDTPVVIVVLDELPLASLLTDNHRVDRHFFPNVANLEGESTWYPRALSVADNTLSAVPSILSGEKPTLGSLFSKRKPPGRPQYPDTVCSTAERAGYKLYSSEPETDFCARYESFGTRLFALLDQGIPSKPPDFLPEKFKSDNPDQLTPGWLFSSVVNKVAGLFPAPEDNSGLGRDRTFEHFTENMPDGGRTMSVIHIILPHVEYQYLPDGRVYSDKDLSDIQTIAGMAMPENKRESAKNMQQMTSQMMYTDHLVGGMINQIKKAGTWDKTLFILTADHGASYRNGSPRRSLDKRNAGWLMPVPLFIKYPGQKSGKVVNSAVDSRDIEPTALGEIGLKPSPRSTGRDLATARLEPRPDATGVSSREGEVTLPRKRIENEEDQAIRWRNRVFSSGTLNAIGGHGDLIGKSVADLPGLKPLEFNPIPSSVYDHVLLDRPTPIFGRKAVPAYFQASLPGVTSDPGPLVVTLNGKVAATTRAWKRDDGWMTAVNLKTGAFRNGNNPTGVYAISGVRAHRGS